jgi:hypothetical protein
MLSPLGDFTEARSPLATLGTLILSSLRARRSEVRINNLIALTVLSMPHVVFAYPLSMSALTSSGLSP